MALAVPPARLQSQNYGDVIPMEDGSVLGMFVRPVTSQVTSWPPTEHGNCKFRHISMHGNLESVVFRQIIYIVCILLFVKFKCIMRELGVDKTCSIWTELTNASTLTLHVHEQLFSNGNINPTDDTLIVGFIGSL